VGKNSFFLIYLGLTLTIIFTTLIISISNIPYNVFFQSLAIFVILTGFFLTVKNKLKPSLLIFQKTMKDVAKNDLTLDDEDLKKIEELSNFTLTNPKIIIKYTNLILQNLNTVLQAAKNDRDYINKNRKLRDIIIDLNHSIISSENTEVLLEGILKTAIDTIKDGEAGSVMIPDSDGRIKYIAAVGMDLLVLKKTKIKLEEIFLFNMNNGDLLKPVIVRNKAKYHNIYHSKTDTKYIEKSGANNFPCALTAPIIIDGEIYGVLNIDSRSLNAFNQEDIRMMEYFTSEMSVIIKNSELIKKAIYFSRYDSLTNVHNRHYFEDIAKMAFEEAARYKGGLHIVSFDLDNFKSVNDTFGHESGDNVLKLFAEIISKSIRGSDVFARFGGDEFIALFKNSTAKNVEKRITSIKKELEKSPLLFGSVEYQVKFSYGISEFPAEGIDLEELLRKADDYMYENKQENKKEGTK